MEATQQKFLRDFGKKIIGWDSMVSVDEWLVNNTIQDVQELGLGSQFVIQHLQI